MLQLPSCPQRSFLKLLATALFLSVLNTSHATCARTVATMGSAHIDEDTQQSRDQVAEVLRAYIAHNPTNPYSVINGIEIPCEHVISVNGKVVSIRFRYKINSEKYSKTEMNSSPRSVVLDESSIEVLVNGNRVISPAEVTLVPDGSWKITFKKVPDDLRSHLDNLQTSFPYKLTGKAFEQLTEGAQFLARFQQDTQRQGNSAAVDDFKHRLLITTDSQHFQSTLDKLRLKQLSAKLNPAPTAEGDPKFGAARHELLKYLSLRGINWSRVGSSDLTLDYPLANTSLLLRAKYTSDSHHAENEKDASSSLSLRSLSVVDPQTGAESYLTDSVPFAEKLDQLTELNLNFSNLDYALRLQLSLIGETNFAIHPIIRGDLLKIFRQDLETIRTTEAHFVVPTRGIMNLWDPAAVQNDIRGLPNNDALNRYMGTLRAIAGIHVTGAFISRVIILIFGGRQILGALIKSTSEQTMHQELDSEIVLETEMDKAKVKFTVSRTEQEDTMKVKNEDSHYFDKFKKQALAPRIFVEQVLEDDTRIGYYARITRNTKNSNDVYLQLEFPRAKQTQEDAPRYDD